MNILHINEQLSHSVSSKMDYYKMGDYVFGISLSILAAGNGKDKLQVLNKNLANNSVKLLIMNEPKSCADVVYADGSVKSFDIKMTFNILIDMIMEQTNSRSIRLSKANWERHCVKLSLMSIPYKAGKFGVVRGRSDGKYGKKLQINYLDKKTADAFLTMTPGIIGTVISLFANEVENIILWEEDHVLGIKLINGKYYCFNCNSDTYNSMRDVIWPELVDIVRAEEDM